MDRSDLDEIQNFLAMMVGLPDLYVYLQLAYDCDKEEIENAVRRRRSWAQGQQANPKYRNEALWIIKNIQLIRAALVDHREEYLEELRTQQETEALEALTRFILKRLKDGALPPEDVEEVYAKGVELTLTEDAVRRRIDAIEAVEAEGLIPKTEAEEPTPNNHYVTLGASPGDPLEKLESAYRDRYRWARNLRDTEESSRAYAELDEAWRILKDPEARAEYDAENGFAAPGDPDATAAIRDDTEDSDDPEADHIGYLPPPSEEPEAASSETETPEVTVTVEDEPSEDGTAEAGLDGDSPAPSTAEDEDPLLAALAADEPEQAQADSLLAAMDDIANLEVEADDDAAEALPAPEPATTESIDEDEDEEPILDVGDIGNVEGPVLQIEGPKQYRIRTGQQPYPIHITVKNTGEGPMAGNLTCDQPWVSVSPAFLNPNRPEHKIEVLIDPEQMPGNAGQAVVQFNMDHGESETITVDAVKHLVSPVLLVTVILALLGVAGLVGGIYFSGVFGGTPEAPPRTILTVQVDPPAGEVFINDQLVGKQGTLSLVDSFPVDRPFQVRVELDGFEPWTKEATVPHGQQIRVEADLTLRDPMQFEIRPTMRAAEIEPRTITHHLEQREQSFNNCFTKHLRPDSAYMASVTATCVVSSRGFVARVDYKGANFKSPEVKECLTRQLRALELPVIPADYALFDHTFRARVGPTRVPTTPQVEPDGE